MPAKKTIQDCYILAKNYEGHCLSEEYTNSKTKMLWECKNLHRWHSTYNDVYNGYWCMDCSGTKKHTIEDCHKLAELKNGKCLSFIYINNKNKLEWQCSKLHIWLASYNSIQQGNWCPNCSDTTLTTKYMQKLAISKDGLFLSDHYINCKIKYSWECKKKHQWSALSTNIISGGWCPYCAKKAKYSLEYCNEIAEQRNGKCLSEQYTNTKTPLLWECNRKHNWLAAFSDILRGGWCSSCNESNEQKKLLNIISSILNQEYISNYRKLECFTNPKTGRKLEIDGWFPKIKLAVEYDGMQHFKPINFSGNKEKTKKDFKDTIIRDKIKNNLAEKAIKNKEICNFIRFSCKDHINEGVHFT